jgi:hypothetical protein
MKLVWRIEREAYCKAWTASGGCYTIMIGFTGHYSAQYLPPPSRRRNKLGIWQEIGYARSIVKVKAKCEQHHAKMARNAMARTKSFA